MEIEAPDGITTTQLRYVWSTIESLWQYAGGRPENVLP
jgi:hypothetical protein